MAPGVGHAGRVSESTPDGRRTVPYRAPCVGAAAWSALYVASKVHLALAGELGVAGGPRVTDADVAAYGPGEVAAAQWANAAVGVVAVLLLLAPLLPVADRVPRWVLVGPLAALTLLTGSLAVGMLGGALLTDRGGAVFGLYCLVWTALVGATAVGHHRARHPGRDASARVA